MNHTPDKWILDEDGEPFIYQLNEAGTNLFSLNVQGGNVDTGERTSREQRRAIAEFIYTACTAHEELVAMVKEFIQEYQEMGIGDTQTVHNAQQLLTTIEKGA